MSDVKEPIYCDVGWCIKKDNGAAVAKYFCETENQYVCEEDNKFCHQKAHKWRELTRNEKRGGPKEH